MTHPTKEELRIELDRRRAARSFAEFAQMAWPVIEPDKDLVWNWHMQAICDHLQALVEGRFVELGLSNRLLVNVPPGTSKSILVSVLLQAWEWGPAGRASMRYLSTSYNDIPVNRDTRKTRDLILSEWYQARWPEVYLTRRAETSFANDRTGTRQGSPFGSLTSQRGDRLIIDDPHSTETAESDADRLRTTRKFREGATNRLNDQKQSAIIVIMQRLHENDVSGTIAQVGMEYVHLCLPMEFEPERCCYSPIKPAYLDEPPIRARYDALKQIWYKEGDPLPDERREVIERQPWQTVYRQDPRTDEGELLDPVRFPADEVAKLQRDQGSYGYAGQYQQRPAPRSGGLIKREWFDERIIGAAPPGTVWVRHWDLAATAKATAAYTAGVKMGRTTDGRYVIAHIARTQSEGHQVRKLIRAMAEVDGRAVTISLPQDPGQAGKVQKQDYVAWLAGYVVRVEPERGDKEQRAEPFAVQCEAGNVYLVRGPWIEAFLDEACLFPNGKFKDQVDACSGAFARLVTTPKPKTTTKAVRGLM